jgi:hypothetical protein
MRKFLFILVTSLLLALLLFIVLQYVVAFHSQKGALQVTSSPESKVYLDGKYLGQTPLCKCEANDVLATGDYTIRLVPSDSSFSEFQEKITISEGVLTVVDRKFSQAAESEGSIISLSPLPDKNKTSLLVLSFPQDATVLLDGWQIGRTPIEFQNPKETDHNLQISKIGYQDKMVRVRTPKGYKLTVAVYLGTSPDLAGVQASPSASLESLPGKTVEILSTPTGFLRVRADSSTLAEEVTTVFPGETYPIVDEKNGWYKIRLKDGKTGWVTSQYAKKE